LKSGALVYHHGTVKNRYIFPECSQKQVYIPEGQLGTGIFPQKATKNWYISARGSKVLVHMFIPKGQLRTGIFQLGADENLYISPKGELRTDCVVYILYILKGPALRTDTYPKGQ
jgi:hypothetical protein